MGSLLLFPICPLTEAFLLVPGSEFGLVIVEINRPVSSVSHLLLRDALPDQCGYRFSTGKNMALSNYLLFLFISLLIAERFVCAITFDLPPGKTECFFEDVHQGTTINGAFAVVQGGSHMEVDVSIFNPDEKQVYNVKREGDDKFQLKADKDGTYRFCFSNTVSLVQPTSFPCTLLSIVNILSVIPREWWIDSNVTCLIYLILTIATDYIHTFALLSR